MKGVAIVATNGPVRPTRPVRPVTRPLPKVENVQPKVEHVRPKNARPRSVEGDLETDLDRELEHWGAGFLAVGFVLLTGFTALFAAPMGVFTANIFWWVPSAMIVIYALYFERRVRKQRRVRKDLGKPALNVSTKVMWTRALVSAAILLVLHVFTVYTFFSILTMPAWVLGSDFFGYEGIIPGDRYGFGKVAVGLAVVLAAMTCLALLLGKVYKAARLAPAKPRSHWVEKDFAMSPAQIIWWLVVMVMFTLLINFMYGFSALSRLVS